MVTLQAISKKIGVSVSAISQVLNNHPNSSTLRPETRERILKAVKAMGYRRNEIAVETRTGICRSVALLCDSQAIQTDNCGNKILAGALIAASEEGVNMRVYEISKLKCRLEEILSYRIKYLLCFTFDKRLQKEIREFCERNKLCLCFIQEGGDGKFPVVYSDDKGAMRDAVLRFSANGHRRIALINYDDGIDFAVQRRLGWLEGMEEAGLPAERNLVSCHEEHDDSRQDIERMLRMPKEQRPTAFLCGGDRLAMLVENVAIRLGMDIPGDCEVVGFGDIVAKDLYVPASAITQPFVEIGKVSLRTVLGKQAKKHLREGCKYLLPAGFIERASTRINASSSASPPASLPASPSELDAANEMKLFSG